MKLFLQDPSDEGLTKEQITYTLRKAIEGKVLKKVLIIPPDYTRFYSNAGYITNFYYHTFVEMGCIVDIIPAVGTHDEMSKEQFTKMFGDIPHDKFIYHNWRRDVVKIGEVPAEYMSQITENLWNDSVSVEVSPLVMDKSYDLIISVGQVVPHEVVGMANHSKNIFVGVGGSKIINSSHMVGAIYGMERMMGKDNTPVRRLLDYSLDHFLKDRPILFVLTVTTAPQELIKTHGLFIGDERNVLEAAITLSQKKNIDFVDKGIKKCVVYLEPDEYRSTWVGNKSVYRTRMAIADGGELIVLAPGVTKFGEDNHCDRLIRKYGYCGREKMLALYKENKDLQESPGVAAHLIHGSPDGRFTVTYAVNRIDKGEIEAVCFNAADYDEMTSRYNPETLSYGWNTLPDGEEIYFIPNPGLGLWIDKNRF